MAESQRNLHHLSRRWRNVWKYISIINLGPSSREFMWKEIIYFLDHFFFLFRGRNIKQLSVKLTYHPHMSHHIDSWVFVAAKSCVEELCLDFDEEEEDGTIAAEDHFYLLHPCVYNCKSLVILKLAFCQLELPPLVQLQSLIEIDFYRVELPEDSIQTLTSGTPNLKYMFLRECNPTTDLIIHVTPNRHFFGLIIHERFHDVSHETHMYINAPNAQEITFIGDMTRSNYIIENNMKCGRASFYMDIMFKVQRGGHYFFSSKSDALKYETLMQQILGSFKDSKTISLSTWCLQLVSLGELRNFNNGLTFRCTHLELNMCYESAELPGFFYLLQTSYLLEHLVLKTSLVSEIIKIPGEYLRQLKAKNTGYKENVQYIIHNHLNNLKSVEFRHTTGDYKTWEDDSFDESKFFGTVKYGIRMLNMFKNNAKNLQHVILSTEEKQHVLNLS